MAHLANRDSSQGGDNSPVLSSGRVEARGNSIILNILFSYKKYIIWGDIHFNNR